MTNSADPLKTFINCYISYTDYSNTIPKDELLETLKAYRETLPDYEKYLIPCTVTNLSRRLANYGITHRRTWKEGTAATREYAGVSWREGHAPRITPPGRAGQADTNTGKQEPHADQDRHEPKTTEVL